MNRPVIRNLIVGTICAIIWGIVFGAVKASAPVAYAQQAPIVAGLFATTVMLIVAVVAALLTERD